MLKKCLCWMYIKKKNVFLNILIKGILFFLILKKFGIFCILSNLRYVSLKSKDHFLRKMFCMTFRFCMLPSHHTQVCFISLSIVCALMQSCLWYVQANIVCLYDNLGLSSILWQIYIKILGCPNILSWKGNF